MYKINYDLQGNPSGIQKGNMSIPIYEDNADYQDFLKWNAEQETPLDLKSTIEPVVPETPRDLAKELDELKARVESVELAAK